MAFVSESLTNLLDLNPISFQTKSAYEAGLVQDVDNMNKTFINGYEQKQTSQTMFPPVCIKNHWDPEALSKYVLPGGDRIPLPVDPRPLVRNCTRYVTTTPVDVSDKSDSLKRESIGLTIQPGGSAGKGVPYEVYVKNIEAENDILLNHPQDHCDGNKWEPENNGDIFTNNAKPPHNKTTSFTELSRPIATIIPKGGGNKCKNLADTKSWDRSARVFNNPTREDRMPGNRPRPSEAPLSKKGIMLARLATQPRVWARNSIVFFVGSGDGGSELSDLATGLRSKDWEVTVFSNERTSIIQGISYHDLGEYVPNDIYSCVIMWGGTELIDNYQYRPNTKCLLYVLENEEKDCSMVVKSSVDKIIVKSAFHRSMYNCLPWTKFEVIKSGIPVGLFTNFENRNLPRERYRVFVSEYSLALLAFVKDSWLRIVSTYPGAELHVWETPGDQKSKVLAGLTGMAKGRGIVMHGRGSLEELVRERFRSSVHLYLEDYDQISCDTLRLSALAGCIPIMPRRGVYTELGGVNVNGNVNNPDTLLEYAKAVSAVFKDDIYSSGLRKRLQTDSTLLGWNVTAERWLLIIKSIQATKE